MLSRIEDMYKKRNKCWGRLGKEGRDFRVAGKASHGRWCLDCIMQDKWEHEWERCERNKMRTKAKSLLLAFFEPFCVVSSFMSCLPITCSLSDKRDLRTPSQKPPPCSLVGLESQGTKPVLVWTSEKRGVFTWPPLPDQVVRSSGSR